MRGLVAGADLLQHVLDRPRHRHQLLLRGAGVDHVEQQVGALGLLQRGGEGVDELMRQLADEPDGVGQQVGAALERAACACVGSSVWNRRSRTPTSEPVSLLSSVDLPAFV